MIATEPTPAAGGNRSIPLRFEMTSDEAFKCIQQAARSHRSAWIGRLTSIVAACFAILLGAQGQWSGATIFGMASITALTRRDKITSVLQVVFRGTMHSELVADHAGIRGTSESRMRWRRFSQTTPIDHAWRELREMTRLPDCMILEFQNRGVVIVPATAFATPDDVERWQAWAHAGLLAQGRIKDVPPVGDVAV